MVSGFNHAIIEEPWFPEVGTVTNASIISALNLAVENMKPMQTHILEDFYKVG